jgi:hypothetical protein
VAVYEDRRNPSGTVEKVLKPTTLFARRRHDIYRVDTDRSRRRGRRRSSIRERATTVAVDDDREHASIWYRRARRPEPLLRLRRRPRRRGRRRHMPQVAHVADVKTATSRRLWREVGPSTWGT